VVLNPDLCRLAQRIREIGFFQLPAAFARSASFRLNRLIAGFYREHLYPNPLLVKAFPFKRPPILLISYPRSGSSWIGKILGFSPDVAYLREPIHQRFQQRFKVPALLDPEIQRETLRCHTHPNDAMLQYYLLCADEAFVGLVPPHPADVLEDAHDFHFLKRSRKCLLIKEINPLMTKTFVNRHSPQVIMLLRHPAAVADSFERLNWIMEEDMETFGYWYGVHMHQAIKSAQAGPLRIIQYENFAANPAEEYIKLFEWLDIRTPKNFQQILHDFCENPQGADHPYAIRRSSQIEAEKWKTGFSRQKIEAVMRGYYRSELPYYRDSQ
jgi:hypothetical protein